MSTENTYSDRDQYASRYPDTEGETRNQYVARTANAKPVVGRRQDARLDSDHLDRDSRRVLRLAILADREI
jgi:hypothetical protein